MMPSVDGDDQITSLDTNLEIGNQGNVRQSLRSNYWNSKRRNPSKIQPTSETIPLLISLRIHGGLGSSVELNAISSDSWRTIFNYIYNIVSPLIKGVDNASIAGTLGQGMVTKHQISRKVIWR